MKQSNCWVPNFTDSSVSTQLLPVSESDASSKKRSSPPYTTTVDQGARCSRRRKSSHSNQFNNPCLQQRFNDNVDSFASYIQVSPPIEFRVVEESFKNYSSTNVESRPNRQAWLHPPGKNHQSLAASLSTRRATGIIPTIQANQPEQQPTTMFTIPEPSEVPTVIPTLSSRRPTAMQMQRVVRQSVGGQRGSQLSRSHVSVSAVEAQTDIQFSLNGNNRKSILQKTTFLEKINRRNTSFPPSQAQESSHQMVSSRKFDVESEQLDDFYIDNHLQSSNSVHTNTQPSTQIYLNWNATSGQMNASELKDKIRIPRRNTGMPPPKQPMQLQQPLTQSNQQQGNLGNTLQPSQAKPSFIGSGHKHLSMQQHNAAPSGRVQRKNTSFMPGKPAHLSQHGLRNQQQQQHHLTLPSSLNTRSQALHPEMCCVAGCNAVSSERGFCFAHGQRVRNISISRQQ